MKTKRTFLSVMMIVVMLFSTTLTCFASTDGTMERQLQNADELNVGDIIHGGLIVSEHSTFYPGGNDGTTITPFEQGTYWYYGGKRTYNEAAFQVTRSAVSAVVKAALGPIGWRDIGAISVELIMNVANNKDMIRMKTVETCTYKHSGQMYQHHHLVEFYVDGKFEGNEEYTYYDYNGRHPNWK